MVTFFLVTRSGFTKFLSVSSFTILRMSRCECFVQIYKYRAVKYMILKGNTHLSKLKTNWTVSSLGDLGRPKTTITGANTAQIPQMVLDTIKLRL